MGAFQWINIKDDAGLQTAHRRRRKFKSRSVVTRNFFCDCQAQARACATCPTKPAKALHRAMTLGIGYARPAVLNDRRGPAISVSGRNTNPTPVRAVIDGVLDEIPDCLRKQQRLAVHHDRFCRSRKLKLVSVLHYNGLPINARFIVDRIREEVAKGRAA